MLTLITQRNCWDENRPGKWRQENMDSRTVWRGWYFPARIMTQGPIFLRHAGSLSGAFSYMMKCFFTDAAIALAPIRDSVSLRSPSLHQSHHDNSLLLPSNAWSKTEFQPGFWKKISPLPSSQQKQESLSICWHPDLNSRGFRSCRHVPESRSNQGGDRRASWSRTRFNSASILHPHPKNLTVIRAEARLERRNTHADVY